MSFTWVIGMLERLGLDKCLIAVLVIALAMSVIGKNYADDRYSPRAYASERNDAFALEITELKKTVNDMRASQLAQSIRSTHRDWCKDKSEYWWATLQTYQTEYRQATKNGAYPLPECESYGL